MFPCMRMSVSGSLGLCVLCRYVCLCVSVTECPRGFHPDVSRCVFSDHVCACMCVSCLCRGAPSGPRAEGRAGHHPVRSQPAMSSWSLLPASLPGQPSQPSKTPCALSSKSLHLWHRHIPSSCLWHRHSPWHACPLALLPGWCACRCGQHLAALLVLSKEWIIIPGQAASATNLREIIVERVERKKKNWNFNPASHPCH